MLDGVGGGLGLGVVLDVLDLDDGARVHLVPRLGQRLGARGGEPVAPVLVARGVDGRLDRDLRRVVVDPCGRVLGVRVGLHPHAVLEVLDRVEGVLGLPVVLDVGERDGGAARDGGPALDGGRDRGELVALVGLGRDGVPRHHDAGMLVVDPGGPRVGGAILGLLHALDDVLDGVGGGLGLGVVLDAYSREGHIFLAHRVFIASLACFTVGKFPMIETITDIGSHGNILNLLHGKAVSVVIQLTVSPAGARAVRARLVGNLMGCFGAHVVANFVPSLNDVGRPAVLVVKRDPAALPIFVREPNFKTCIPIGPAILTHELVSSFGVLLDLFGSIALFVRRGYFLFVHVLASLRQALIGHHVRVGIALGFVEPNRNLGSGNELGNKGCVTIDVIGVLLYIGGSNFRSKSGFGAIYLPIALIIANVPAVELVTRHSRSRRAGHAGGAEHLNALVASGIDHAVLGNVAHRVRLGFINSEASPVASSDINAVHFRGNELRVARNRIPRRLRVVVPAVELIPGIRRSRRARSSTRRRSNRFGSIAYRPARQSGIRVSYRLAFLPLSVQRGVARQRKNFADGVRPARTIRFRVPNRERIPCPVKHTVRQRYIIVLFSRPCFRSRVAPVVSIEDKAHRQTRIHVTSNELCIAVHLDSVPRIVRATRSVNLPTDECLAGRRKQSVFYRSLYAKRVAVSIDRHASETDPLVVRQRKPIGFPAPVQGHITGYRRLPAIGNQAIGSRKIPVPSKKLAQTLIALTHNVHPRIFDVLALSNTLRLYRGPISLVRVELGGVLGGLPFRI